jgi:hypothetical protein
MGKPKGDKRKHDGGLLAAGNPQLTLAAHDRFCERLSRQYRSGFE